MSNSLTSNQKLLSGQSISSTNGMYTVLMCPNGNLALINNNSGNTSFISVNPGKNGAYLIMQPSGDLEIIWNGMVIWSTNTATFPNAFAIIQNDGTFEVLSATNNVEWLKHAPQVIAALDPAAIAVAFGEIGQGLAVLLSQVGGGQRVSTSARSASLGERSLTNNVAGSAE